MKRATNLVEIMNVLSGKVHQSLVQADSNLQALNEDISNIKEVNADIEEVGQSLAQNQDESDSASLDPEEFKESYKNLSESMDILKKAAELEKRTAVLTAEERKVFDQYRQEDTMKQLVKGIHES